MSLLRIENVSKRFDTVRLLRQPGPLAVNDVSLSLAEGRTLGIVGESGSGKSTLLRMVLRLAKPSAGRIMYGGSDVWRLCGPGIVNLRRNMQAVFQDPASSFNPRQRIGKILRAPLDVHGIGAPRTRDEMVAEIMGRVGLPLDLARSYPHQLSGGQAQRVAIGRAIIIRPSLIVADEPTSALDVSIQAQILNLFQDIQRSFGLTAIFVSHNLAVVRHLSDEVAVMRNGQIVECGETEVVFGSPAHPYTQSLLSAIPDPRRHRKPTSP